jgi:hypothetical protein
LLEDVGEGAYVVLQVKYGLIRLVNTEANLCEQVSNVDLSCPIKKGDTKITKDVELPKEIPPVSLSKSIILTSLIIFDREPILFLPMRILLALRVRRSFVWKQPSPFHKHGKSHLDNGCEGDEETAHWKI